MKTINQNTRFTQAQNTLAELTGAFNAATAEEARLLGLLAAPADTFDPLAAGLRLLRGEPAQRNDSTGLNRELAQVRERLATLHGTQGTLELIAASASGTSAFITFPLKLATP